MGRLREHVDGGDALKGVALSGEPAEVAGKGGGIAGDVDDRGRGQRHEGVEHLGRAADAGWVEEHDVGLLRESREELLDPGAAELDVLDAFKVDFGIVQGRGRLLDGNDALEAPGKDGGEGANTRIGVDKEAGPGTGSSRETRSTRRSAWALFTWKKDEALTWKRRPASSSV